MACPPSRDILLSSLLRWLSSESSVAAVMWSSMDCMRSFTLAERSREAGEEGGEGAGLQERVGPWRGRTAGEGVTHAWAASASCSLLSLSFFNSTSKTRVAPGGILSLTPYTFRIIRQALSHGGGMYIVYIYLRAVGQSWRDDEQSLPSFGHPHHPLIPALHTCMWTHTHTHTHTHT